MRIFAGGIATETNTFISEPTALRDFSVLSGDDVASGHIPYPPLDLVALWGPQAREGNHELIFGLLAAAAPSGVTVRAAYETLRDRLIEKLKAAMPVDVVLLVLHGAMIAQGYSSCETDIVQAVRDIVGKEVVIGIELDLHCNISSSLVELSDIIITFKEYPHIDVVDRARELFDLSIATRAKEITPVMALFDCRMVGLYPTTFEPMRSIVALMFELEREPEVLSVSFAHGFQFADVSHLGSKVLVIANGDIEQAKAVAMCLGRRIFDVRREIDFSARSLPLDSALSQAANEPSGLVVVADQADNPGGGAPGDSTFALHWLIENKIADAAVAIICDPEAVRVAHKAGIGARLQMRIGGKSTSISGAPVDLVATITAVREAYWHEFPQQGGNSSSYFAGNTAAIRSAGLDIIISSARCQCFSPTVFSDHQIDIHEKKLVVVKSAQHFFGAFAPIAKKVVFMSAPGAVPADPRLIRYQHFNSATHYPWNDESTLIDP